MGIRTSNKNKVVNDSEIYKNSEIFKNREVKQVTQYTTPSIRHPNAEEMKRDNIYGMIIANDHE